MTLIAFCRFPFTRRGEIPYWRAAAPSPPATPPLPVLPWAAEAWSGSLLHGQPFGMIQRRLPRVVTSNTWSWPSRFLTGSAATCFEFFSPMPNGVNLDARLGFPGSGFSAACSAQAARC